jgi:tryptophanyl-tRNA synthetase
MSERVLSGVQPTGRLHIGNYYGAIRQWAAGQESGAENFFCIVDLHALTVPTAPEALRESVLYTAAAYLACGIDPQKSVVFRQSPVAEHAELQWILGCMTPLGWLNRMTQFKEKTQRDKQLNCLGLYSYPVLMAADILLYHATRVPVGEDQKQHIELARDIALAVNGRVGQELFTIPEPAVAREAARVMSLRDGREKMSKSAPSDYSRINLTDSDDEIFFKIARAKTDSIPGLTYDPENRPEVANLIRIYAAASGVTPSQVEAEYEGAGASAFKHALTDRLVADVAPIRDGIRRLYDDGRAHLLAVLREGEGKAREVAGRTLREVKEAVGLWAE